MGGWGLYWLFHDVSGVIFNTRRRFFIPELPVESAWSHHWLTWVLVGSHQTVAPTPYQCLSVPEMNNNKYMNSQKVYRKQTYPTSLNTEILKPLYGIPKIQL